MALTDPSTNQRRSELRELIMHAGQRETSLQLLASALEHDQAVLSTLLVWNVLAWVPGTSPDAKRMLLRHAGVGAGARVGHLRDHQVRALCAALRSPAITSEAGS